MCGSRRWGGSATNCEAEMSSPEDHNRAFTLFPLELEVPADSNQLGNMQQAIMPRAHLNEIYIPKYVVMCIYIYTHNYSHIHDFTLQTESRWGGWVSCPI